MDLAAANVHDLRMAEDLLLKGVEGRALDDGNCWSPTLPSSSVTKGCVCGPLQVQEEGERALAPLIDAETVPEIETVIGQLAERYRAKKVWARDRCHLTSRVGCVRSHTRAVFCARRRLICRR